MGCGASRHASTQTDHNGTQLRHSKLRSNRSSVEPLALHQQAVSARKNRHSQDESEWALPVQQKRHAHEDLDWPLPLDEVYPRFQLNDNDSGRYSLTPLSPREETSQSPNLLAEANQFYNEKDTCKEDWKPQTDTKIESSAQVQSQLSARFHASFNLSASDNVSVVMDSLKKSHNDLDDHLKRRLAKVSADAERIIGIIIDDTKKEQKLLLDYDKRRQNRQDELYKEWLQKYVVVLNTWRSKELANLQIELSQYQQQIVKISQERINRLNIEANQLKTQILNEEGDAFCQKATYLTGQLYDVSRDEKNYLGSEWKTELNLRVQANVGRIAPGQSYTNDFDN